MNQYGRSISITGNELFSDFSGDYTLTLYPTDELFAVYRTDNPLIATIGAVVVMVFTSVLFFLYDFLVRRDMNAKQDLLEAKRQFVRFISHEVRTPLNTVSMGLALLQRELQTVLAGVTTTTTTKSSEERSVKDDNNEDASPSSSPPPLTNVTMEHLEDWQELVSMVQSNTFSSVDVLNDILNYDKIAAKSLHLELSTIATPAVIAKTVGEFELPALQKNIDLQVQYRHESDTNHNNSTATGVSSGHNSMLLEELTDLVEERQVVGDVVRITQVLRNLVSNAIKFTPEGGTFLASAKNKTGTGNLVSYMSLHFTI